jgi:sugar/nucleoside kinase (ribokinase family)
MAPVTVIGCVQADVLASPVTDLPPAGGTILTDEMSIRVGGAGANAALALSEKGMRVRLIGCLGDDALGRWMHEELEPVGLSEDLAVLENGSSGLTVALESPERDRTFLTYLGVNADWSAAMIPRDALDTQNLLLCDYFVAPRLQGEAAQNLLQATRAYGGRTFFDTAWDPNDFARDTRAQVAQVLQFVDVFLPNEAEACALAGLPPGAAGPAARKLQKLSGGWVVVKLGARGCLAAGPGGVELRVPAPRVRVVDTTGAGDAFNAGLVHGLSEGVAWPQALALATKFASTIVTRPSSERYRVALLDDLSSE